jgi:hypothetical protein
MPPSALAGMQSQKTTAAFCVVMRTEKVSKNTQDEDNIPLQRKRKRAHSGAFVLPEAIIGSQSPFVI